MEKWVVYALLSMVFAGFTSVIAKFGLSGITGELGITIRTCFVFAFVLAFAWFAVPRGAWAGVGREHLWWLGLSAATTTASWIFYYKALAIGKVSTVAVIDKGSFVVAIVLAALLLKEAITARIAIGAALVLTGLVIASRK